MGLRGNRFSQEAEHQICSVANILLIWSDMSRDKLNKSFLVCESESQSITQKNFRRTTPLLPTGPVVLQWGIRTEPLVFPGNMFAHLPLTSKM